MAKRRAKGTSHITARIAVYPAHRSDRAGDTIKYDDDVGGWCIIVKRPRKGYVLVVFGDGTEADAIRLGVKLGVSEPGEKRVRRPNY